MALPPIAVRQTILNTDYPGDAPGTQLHVCATRTAAGFTDTEFRRDDETGGGPWQREEHSAAGQA